MIFVDLSVDQLTAANARAEHLRVPYEVVIAYLVSERHLPSTVAAIERWGNRPSPHPARPDQGGSWRPITETPPEAT